MPSRREFLFQVGASALGIAGLRIVSGCENISREASTGAQVDYVTQNKDWYWQSGNSPTTKKEEAPDHAVERTEWSMKIAVEGGNDIAAVDWDEMQSLIDSGEAITYLKTLRCVTGSLVGRLADAFISTGIFTGIPLHKVLENRERRVPSDAVKLHTLARDGYKSNIPLDRALEPRGDRLPAILAFQLNGRPLPANRGGPIRLIVPEMWGYKNTKWLSKVRYSPSDDPFGMYEEGESVGFGDAQDVIDDPGRVALSSVVHKPLQSGVEVAGPDVTIKGTSVVGGARVETVELKLDDGPFRTADIATIPEITESIDSARIERKLPEAENFGTPWPPENVWATWSISFEDLAAGEHTVRIRAKDSRGNTQPEQLPDGDEGADAQYSKYFPEVRLEFTVT